MKQRRYEYAVLGYEHPAFFTALISRHRWHFTARIAAWWFNRRWSCPFPHAWVVQDHCVISQLPEARIER